MSTKLFAALALCLGLSGCLTDVDVDDDNVVSGDDVEPALTDHGADLQADLTNEPTDPMVVAGDGNNTCGGQPRLKADGPCVPK